MTPRHAHALALAEAGIPVFPCVVNGKEPATTHGFVDASTDAATINAWWTQADYNIGVEPERAGWCVVDIDGADGIAEWLALTSDRPIPDTYTVRTPRGGTHLYLTGSLPSSVKKIAGSIDTRGRVGYVLVPPSVVNGKPYTVERDIDPAPLPDWIAPLLETKHVEAASAPLVIDYAASLVRARDYVDRWSEPVLEGTRDNTAFKVACELRDLGLDSEDQLAYLTQWNEKFCIPPLTEDELGVKVWSASRNSQNAQAGVNASAPTAETFRAYIETAETTSQSGARTFPEPIKLGALDAEPDEPVEMLIDRWIEKGLFNILRGRGGANKSRLALEWVQMVDAGASVAGFTVQQATGIYISCEDRRGEVKRRRKAQRKKLDLPGSNVLYIDMTDQPDAFLLFVSDDAGVVQTALWPDLERRLKAIAGHKFLVLDSTYDVIDFAGSTKNSDAHVRTVIRMLDRLCRSTDTTILCLWHPSRAGMARGDEGGFATAWDNTPRNAIAITEIEEDRYELAAKKRNDMAKGQPLLLCWSEGALVPIVASEADQIMVHDVVVEIALLAGDSAQAIKKMGKPNGWIFTDIERKLGRRLNVKEIKDHLNEECRRANSRLRYINHDPHGRGEPAGWYRAEEKETKPEEA